MEKDVKDAIKFRWQSLASFSILHILILIKKHPDTTRFILKIMLIMLK